MELWLKNIANSEMTEITYSKGIKKFLEFHNVTLEDIANEWESISSYEKEKAFVKKWNMKIKQFRASLKDRVQKGEIAESTMYNILTPINSFFKWLDTPIRIHGHKLRVTYHNRDITTEEIDRILKHTEKVRDRAIYCMIAQSGLRPTTVSKLRYKHIKEDYEKGIIPMKIDIPRAIAKGKNKDYFTFIGEETVNYLREYFTLRFKGKQPQEEDLVFLKRGGKEEKISTISISIIFGRTALKLGISKDNKGKPRNIRLYCLRKWFRNEASEHKEVDSEYVHHWMGHTLNRMDEHYFTKDVEKHRAKYILAMEHLRINNRQQFSSVSVKQELAKLDFGNMFKDWLLTTEGKQAIVETFKDTIPVELYPIIMEKLQK